MDDTNTFGARLRELREAAQWTQPELAERSGLTKNGIAQLEQGRRQPAWATVCALADVLGVSTEEFRRSTTADPKPRGRPRKAAAGKRRKGGDS